MTFEEYYTHYEIHSGDYMNALKHAWDCACKVQEKRIDELEDELHCVRAYNDELVAELERLKRPISDDQATCRTCGAPINDWYVFDLSTVKQRSSKWR